MEIEASTVFLATLSVIVTVFGALMHRAVKGIDDTIKANAVRSEDNHKALSSKIDGLTSTDTKFSVELAELRVRVTQLEFDVRREKERKP